MKLLSMWVVGLVFVALLAYGGFKLQRWFHWNWGYESQVVETVCEMVNPEYLIDPSKCK